MMEEPAAIDPSGFTEEFGGELEEQVQPEPAEPSACGSRHCSMRR
jgi:hypothetical protein